MELIEYLRHLYRFKYWLLIGLIVGTLVGAALAVTSKDSYQANVSLYIQRKTQEANSQYFTYEGYYAQQTAASYTDTVLKLIPTDEIIAEAIKLAGLQPTTAQISSIRGSIVTKKDAPQLIKVTVTQSNPQLTDKLITGLSTAIKQRTTDLNQYGDNSLSIEQVESTPIVRTVHASSVIYGLVGAIVGFILAIIGTTIWAYVKHSSKSSAKVK